MKLYGEKKPILKQKNIGIVILLSAKQKAQTTGCKKKEPACRSVKRSLNIRR